MTNDGSDITREHPVVVLGGGPAGLTAGYLLAKQGKPVIVLESTDMVGGIARTEVRDGYRFDLGGHRFFTKAKEVDALWHEIMKEEFLKRPRQSRIYWNDKFLEYPLEGMDVIRKLGPVELVRCGLSYLWAAIKPKGREESFEQWVSNRFGKRLYNHFFKTYTEKLWGVSANEIRAEWAAQRIKGLSFFSAAKAAFFGNKGNKIKSLISEFNYPRYGPGQMWEQMTDDIREHGGEVRLNAPVTKLTIADGRITEVIAGGETLTPSHVISSLPLRTTVGIASPEAPAEVRDAARGLRYREFLTVLLVIDGEDLFPDNWIYIHQPGVRVLRIQNFKSWSPWMVPEGSTDASIGMEYFCFEGDELWSMDDDDLVKMAGAGDREAPPRQGRKRQVRIRRPRPQGVPDLRRRVRRTRRHDPALARDDRQPDPGRPQRPAPVQQLGPLDAHRDARRRQHPARDQSRHLGRQRRERVPRGASGERGSVPRGSRYAGDGAAARPGALAVHDLTRRTGAVLVGLLVAASVLPGVAAAAATTPAAATPLGSNGSTNPFSPGIPTPTPTTTNSVPTVSTTTTSSTDSGLSGSSAIAIALGAVVILGGISVFIWRDARKRAPVRRAAAAAAGADGRSGSKARAKPRKLSQAERKRRKRGRAR